MTNLERRVMDKVHGRLGAERLQEVIVYLDPDMKRAAERLSIGDVISDLPWDGYVAFIDLEPRTNWGHACMYLAISRDDDESVEFAAQMPPFNKPDAPAFHLVWRGPLAPEWAVAEPPE